MLHSPTGTRPLSGISILVVDDNVDNAELLDMLLSASGAVVRTANAAAEALDLLAGFKPDVMLLDITLPDMDGYELLGKIRALAGFVEVPAVAVTGHAHERDRDKAVGAGFAVHAVKPFDGEAMIHLVAKLARSRPDPASTAAGSTLDQLSQVLHDEGVGELLKLLNGRVPHRYTALYRYDGPTLRSVALFDRLHPTVTRGGDVPVETSHCWLVERDRASFNTSDASVDPRVAGLPFRREIRAYSGALIRNADGTPFGSLCHFDHDPREVPAGEVALLEQLAPVLARAVALDVF